MRKKLLQPPPPLSNLGWPSATPPLNLAEFGAPAGGITLYYGCEELVAKN